MRTIRPEVTGRSPGLTEDADNRASGPPQGEPTDIELTTPSSGAATPVVNQPKARGPPKSQTLAMSIPQFCDRHGISTAFFYLLQERGQAPRTMRLGSRVLITIEEAQRWREEQTAATD